MLSYLICPMASLHFGSKLHTMDTTTTTLWLWVICSLLMMPRWLLFLIKKIVLCIYFWLCWVYIAALAFSSGGEWGLLSSCSARASHRSGFSCCGAQALGSWASVAASVQAQQLLFSGLAAPRHVGSSLSRDQTRVSCTGKQILYWWATRGALTLTSLHIPKALLQAYWLFPFSYTFLPQGYYTWYSI